MKITSGKIEYSLKDAKINFTDKVNIDDKKNGLVIYSNKIDYDINSQKIFGQGNTKIIDEFDNTYEVSEFEYSTKDKIIKLNNTKVSDQNENTFYLEIAYLDLNKKEIVARY